MIIKYKEEQHWNICGGTFVSCAQVWTGLRFLAGQWMWLNQADLNHTSLPLCPHEVQHCGALSKSDTSSLEPADCLMRLNFLCYSTP